MKVEFSQSAIKDLKKIDKTQAKKIYDKIKELNNFPKISNIIKLTNFTPAYRLRVGDFRVLFDFDSENELITIGKVLHRKEAYR